MIVSQLENQSFCCAAVEAELQRAERDREQREAEHVELALVRLGLGHEPQHQQRRR